LTGVSSLAFALGMYLPLELNTPILAGAIVAWFVRRSAKGDTKLQKARHDRGTLVASGLIAGGALAGVLQAVTDVFQEWSGWTMPQLGATGWGGNWIGLLVFIALGTGIYLDAHRGRPDNQTS
jgi:hypothetical protein